MENKPASLLVVRLGKELRIFPYLGVVNRWPATPETSTLLRFDRFLAIGG